MPLTTIKAYTYDADIYCPECIKEVLPTGEGEAYDGWALAAGVYVSPEEFLSEIADAFGIDRDDETTFDSGDFPKVVLNLDPMAVNICGACFTNLTD